LPAVPARPARAPRPAAGGGAPRGRAPPGRGGGPPPPPASNGLSKNARKKEQQLEDAVEQAELALAQLEEELADPAAWATKYESAKNEARHTAAKRAVEAAYAALEEHMARYAS
jgi:ATP-binding cassette subfamily F protein 3